MRSVGQRVLGRWLQGAVSRCFELWAAAAEQAAQERHQATTRQQSALQVFNTRLRRDAAVMADAVAAWRQHATLLRRMRDVGGKVVFKMLNSCLNRAFSCWSRHCCYCRKIHQLETKLRVRWVGISLRSSFSAWCFFVSHSKHNLHECFQTLLTSRCSRFFFRWQGATRNAKHIFSRGKRVLGRWVQYSVARYFERWALLSKQVSPNQNDSAVFIKRKQTACKELIFWIGKHIQHVSALKSCYSHSPLRKEITNIRSPISTRFGGEHAAFAVSPCFPAPANQSMSPSILNVSNYGTPISHAVHQELSSQQKSFSASPTYAGSLQFLAVLADRRLNAARNTELLLQKMV